MKESRLKSLYFELGISAAKFLLIKLTLACVIHGVQATRLLANICDASWLDKRDSLHGLREKCRARSLRFFHSHTQSGTRVMGGGGGLLTLNTHS